MSAQHPDGTYTVKTDLDERNEAHWRAEVSRLLRKVKQLESENAELRVALQSTTDTDYPVEPIEFPGPAL